ncbi:MAG: conserved hypothetical protein [Methanobrevibacter sp. CfCl-M3]
MENKDLIFILKSEIRFYILISIKNKNKTPTELTKNNKYHITHISYNLKKLEEKEYIKCVNPNNRKNKQFSISTKGKEVLKQ